MAKYNVVIIDKDDVSGVITGVSINEYPSLTLALKRIDSLAFQAKMYGYSWEQSKFNPYHFITTSYEDTASADIFIVVPTDEKGNNVSGCSGLEYDEQDLIEYIQDYLADRDFTAHDIRRAWNIMGRNRVPLYYADSNLFETIQDAINDFCEDYEIEQTEDDYIDPEEVFKEIEL